MHAKVTLPEALATWTRIALLSFGGPAGQIALMHRVLVEEKRWISEERFLHALNYCMLLPGPEAQQLATYIGWLMHGTRGGLAAGILFILPGFFAIMAFSVLYVTLGHHPFVAGLFLGLKAAVVALVLQAVLRVGRRALRNEPSMAMAALAFIALALFNLPFPLVVLAAASFGYLWTRLGRRDFLFPVSHATAAGATPRPGEDAVRERESPSRGRAARILATFLPLWLAPVAALAFALGPTHVLTQVGAFFAKMAVVTFGGAYAVLAYVAQQAVDHYAWVTPEQMLDGLGLAETTPGPLIMVVQFVGFLAGYQAAPGGSMVTAVVAACLTVWVTFVPCFLWIFLGAPYVESLRRHEELSGALAAITAAVVGIIANLAFWFTLHALFASVTSRNFGPATIDLPQPASIQVESAVLTALALVMTFGLRWSFARTLPLCAAIGAVVVLLDGWPVPP
jgi:chromate transporter